MDSPKDTTTSQDNLKERTAAGLFWSLFGNGAQQVVVMIIGIILTRLLDPADYGLVGMLTVFSILASNLQESGFTAALTVKKEATAADFNAVFWTSTFLSALLYLVLFCCAPLIAAYDHAPELTLLGRVIFLGFFFTSLAIPHVAWLQRNLKVKEKTTAQVSASLISGIVGLACAAMGCGVWSLVAMDLAYKLVHTLVVWRATPWHPTFNFDLRPAWRMFGFGSRLLVTNSLNTLNNQLLQSLLGHFYPKHEIGYYSQANKWNTLGTSLLGGMLNTVARPVLAKVDDDADRQKRIMRKMLRFTAMLSFPAMMGIGLIADVVPLMGGDKWLFCIPYLQLLTIGGAFLPVNEIFSNLMISRSRSDYYMWTTLAFLVIQLALVVGFTTFLESVASAVAACGFPDGLPGGPMMPLLVCVVAMQPLWTIVLFCVVRRLVAVRFFEVLTDIVPFILAAVVSIATGYFAAETIAPHFGFSPILTRILLVILKVIVTATLYCAIMWTTRVAVFRECLDFAKEKFLKKSAK